MTRFLLILFFLFYTNILIFGQQRIDFEATEISVIEALNQLSKETNIDITFSSSFFDNTTLVSIQANNQSIDEILEKILLNTSMDYKWINDRIVLFRKKLKQYTISGYLQDKDTGERLISATVYCKAQQKGTITNEYGFYSLTLNEGQTQLSFNYLAYSSHLKELNLQQNIRENIGLVADATLAEIIVKPKQKDRPIATNDQNKVIELNKAFIEATPTLGGMEDPVRTAQLLPSVQSQIDGLGGLHVRGGDSGQNLMLLDGVPIYIPFHLLGMYSIYNSSTINSAKLLKGNFSARYGGRLASVFDVRMREGNQYEWKKEAAVNLNTLSLLIEGPIKKEKSSLLIAGRFSPSAFLLLPSIKQIYFQISPYDYDNETYLSSLFYDFNIKFNYVFSPKDRIYLSFFNGRDVFNKDSELEDAIEVVEDKSEVEFSWSNTIGALRWNHLFNKKLFANTTLMYSNYDYFHSSLDFFWDEEEEFADFYYFNSYSINQDIGLKVDFDYLPNARHTLRWGAGVSNHTFSPQFIYLEDDEDEFEELEYEELNDLEDFDDFIDTIEIFAYDGYWYIEDNFTLGKKWLANVGIRNSFFINETTHIQLEPRLSLRYSPSAKIHLSLAASRMAQYLHLIANSSLRLPNDIWLPASSQLQPQLSWQYEAGFEMRPNTHWNFSVDAYYKTMENLYKYPEDNFEIIENEDQSEMLQGNGEAYGIETLLKYTHQRRGAMLSYTYAQTHRQYDEINGGFWYPYEFDQRHQYKVFLYQKIGSHFQLSLHWLYNTPAPQLNIAIIESGSGLVNTNNYAIGQKNMRRSTPYNRLDLNLSYNLKQKNATHQFKIGTYNTYNRENIAYYATYEEDTPIFSIPFQPSFYYKISF